MTKNVNSHNQSGGITAHNVNINKLSSKAPKKKKNLLGLIVAIFGIVAALVAILTYFDITPWSKKMAMEDEKNINITSYNQSGGITAYNVNVAPQDRKLTPELANQLISHIKENSVKKISIVAVLGDQEAYQFASIRKSFLENNGYSVDGVSQSVYSKPIKGQIIEPTKDGSGINIIIGRK